MGSSLATATNCYKARRVTVTNSVTNPLFKYALDKRKRFLYCRDVEYAS
jgi:hypothetical protein